MSGRGVARGDFCGARRISRQASPRSSTIGIRETNANIQYEGFKLTVRSLRFTDSIPVTENARLGPDFFVGGLLHVKNYLTVASWRKL
jgi:hypothetical protein